jgi:hypothetical protein
MLLDDRLRQARAVAVSLPVDDPPPIEQIRRRARRRRALAGAALTFAVVAGTAAVWAAAASRTGPIRPTPPVDSPPAATSAVDEAPIVTPVVLGGGDLRYVPGAWGTNATVSVVDGVVHVTTTEASATITDAGPAPAPADDATDDPTVSLEDIPRLGPYGPLVTVDDTEAATTASVVIAGRRVIATSADASADELMQLLRSVTIEAAVQPIRPTDTDVELPDVAGLDYRDATERLESAGLRVLWGLASQADGTIGAVTAMDPPVGSTVAAGSAVALTVTGPASHPRGGAPFVAVAGPAGVDSPGFIDLRAAPPTGSMPGGDVVAVHGPIVFLHGELVGLWAMGSGAFDGGQLLADVVDPAYRYEPPSQPPTVPAQPLTSTASFGDVAVDAPSGWSIRENACPATRTIVVGSPPGECEETVPGPWISLQAAPAELTPCRSGGIGTSQSGGNLRVCWTDNLSNGTTDVFVLLGTDVLVVNQYGSAMLQDHADMQAAVDSLRAPSARGEVGTSAYLQVVDAVAAVIDGRCDDLAQYLSPLDSETPGCEPTAAGTTPIDTSQFTAVTSAPTSQLDDLTFDAYDVTTGEGATWHVEYRTYYDPASLDAVTYITRIDPPT